MLTHNLRHLYALTEIGRRGSLSGAAAGLHISQSAITQALRRVEHDAGARLFERTRRGMVPTPAGHLLLARLERAFAWLQSSEPKTGQQVGPPRATTAELTALVAVVETGGFSLAARRLGLAQPSVYRAARSLEVTSGEVLFRRTHRGVEASMRAKQLARCASLAFSEIRQGFEELAELDGRIQGQVRVGCLPLARVRIVPDAVNQLLRSFPSARVSLIDGPYDELLHALRHGHLDLIIGALRSPAPTDDIQQEPLFRDPLALVVRAGHPILRSPAPNPEQLARLHWIAPREGTPARDYFKAFFTARGLPAPPNVIECSSLVATRGLLLGSDRAALLSARQIGIELASGQLSVLLSPLPGTERAIGLTVRRDWQPTPLMKDFMALVKAAVAGEAHAAHQSTT